jgi:hypothetical protein
MAGNSQYSTPLAMALRKSLGEDDGQGGERVLWAASAARDSAIGDHENGVTEVAMSSPR